MEYSNVQWLSTAPLYIRFRKHFCPDCKAVLIVVKKSRILYPGSDAAHWVSQRTGIPVQQIGERRTGKTKVVWKELACPQCGSCYTVNQMKEIEGVPL